MTPVFIHSSCRWCLPGPRWGQTCGWEGPLVFEARMEQGWGTREVTGHGSPDAPASSLCHLSIPPPFGSQRAGRLKCGDGKMETEFPWVQPIKWSPLHPMQGLLCHPNGHSKCPVLSQTSLCPSLLFSLDLFIFLPVKLIPPKMIFKNIISSCPSFA